MDNEALNNGSPGKGNHGTGALTEEELFAKRLQMMAVSSASSTTLTPSTSALSVIEVGQWSNSIGKQKPIVISDDTDVSIVINVIDEPSLVPIVSTCNLAIEDKLITKTPTKTTVGKMNLVNLTIPPFNCQKKSKQTVINFPKQSTIVPNSSSPTYAEVVQNLDAF